ncbi:MAG: glycosyltransferase family A protein [Microlunatus sp.]
MMRFIRPEPLATKPSVSVVVPCYNYGQYLPQLIDYVLDQPGVDVEILIVDDKSPDGSGDVAEQLAENNPAVSVLRHKVNAGHIRTYNDGLSRIKGDYVALLSADDLLPRGALSRAIALMEACPSVGLVYGYARSFSGAPPEPNSHLRSWTFWHGFDWLRSSLRQARCFISSPEVVMRREALCQVGLYDPRLPHSADFDLWMRTALHWDIGRVNGPDQALYRVHDSNMHLTDYAGWVTDLRERRLTFEILFDEHARDRADVKGLRDGTMRALALESLNRGIDVGHTSGQTDSAYGEFAQETDPSVVETATWRQYQRSLSGTRSPNRVRAIRRRISHHITWRRERRFGV